jgi:hypothetical protein
MKKYTEIEIWSIENAMRRYKNLAKYLQVNIEKCKSIKDIFELITQNVTENVIDHDFSDEHYKYITFDDGELRFTVSQYNNDSVELESPFEVYNTRTTELVDWFDDLREAKVYVDQYYAEEPEPYEPDPYDEYMDRKLEEKEWN